VSAFRHSDAEHRFTELGDGLLLTVHPLAERADIAARVRTPARFGSEERRCDAARELLWHPRTADLTSAGCWPYLSFRPAAERTKRSARWC
jgi:hypothetical protein